MFIKHGIDLDEFSKFHMIFYIIKNWTSNSLPKCENHCIASFQFKAKFSFNFKIELKSFLKSCFLKSIDI